MEDILIRSSEVMRYHQCILLTVLMFSGPDKIGAGPSVKFILSTSAKLSIKSHRKTQGKTKN